MGEIIVLVCPVCKKSYSADKVRLKHGRQTTCSRSCSYELRAVEKTKRVTIECPCGSPIIKIISSKLKYCSIECRRKFRKKTKERKDKGSHKIPPKKLICYYCKVEFVTFQKRKSNRIFCSRICYEKQKSIDMSGMGNHMYGKSPLFIKPTWRYGWFVVGKNTCFFRSSWELSVALYLEKTGMDWRYEYIRYDLDGLTYVPDFFIIENGEISKIIEVKGWIKEKDKKKIEMFRAKYSIPIEMWDRKIMKLKGLLDCCGYGRTDI